MQRSKQIFYFLNVTDAADGQMNASLRETFPLAGTGRVPVLHPRLLGFLSGYKQLLGAVCV